MYRFIRKWATALFASAALLSAGSAAADEYPSRTVRFVVGYSAGGPTDVIARVVAQDLTTNPGFGQTVIVENKTGANGNIATETVARAPADGYTLIVNTLSHNVNPLLNPTSYDPVKDFAPVSLAVTLPQVIVVGNDAPYKTIGDLIARAKSKAQAVTYGSAGNGGSAHLAAALLEQRSGTQMIHVPFRGNAPALSEVMAGRVDFMFYPMIGVSDLVEQKRIRVLAVTTAQPHPDYPGVPTMAEAGFPGFEDYVGPVGFLAPAGTPPQALQKLSTAIRASLEKPETQQRLKGLGAVVVGSTPEEYRKWLEEDAKRWAELVKAANIKGS